MTLTISKIGKYIDLDAERDALWIRGTGSFALNDQTTWPAELLESEAGRLVSIEIEQLLEQGFAEEIQDQVKIPYSGFSTIRQIGIQLLTKWTQWSPFMLSISPIGDLGRKDFSYRYSFYLGARQVAIERTGYYVRRKEHAGIYHLDDQTFALVESMDRFNGLTPEAKSERENWLTFSVVKGCALEVGADLDRYLQSNEVLVPSRIALGIKQHSDDSISFVPRCSGVPDADFEKAFLALPKVESTYSLDLPPGRRLRVILDDDQKEVLSRMQAVRHARGDLKKTAITNPEAFLLLRSPRACLTACISGQDFFLIIIQDHSQSSAWRRSENTYSPLSGAPEKLSQNPLELPGSGEPKLMLSSECCLMPEIRKVRAPRFDWR